MKVLLIHHGNILGGASLSLCYLTRKLEDQPNLEIEIVCHAPAMREFFAKNLKSQVNLWMDPCTFFGKILIGWSSFNSLRSYSLFFNDLIRMPKSILTQLRLIRKRSPDLVHLNSATMFSSAIAARLAGVPIIWHIREPLQGNRLIVKLVGFFIRKTAAAVIAISEEEAVRLGEDTDKKVYVIYNPINTEALNPDRYNQLQEKRKLGFEQSDKLVLSLGGVNPRKGTLELVKAMQYTDPDTYLLIAGPPLPKEAASGSYEQKITKILSLLGNNQVRFTGNLENIVPLLAACDVLVFAGTKPHFPRPVFEAWQMSKPVVVFDMNGISNQVQHRVDGIIVKEISGSALGSAIVDLLRDTNAIQRYGRAGRLKSKRMCNPVTIAERVFEIYSEILHMDKTN